MANKSAKELLEGAYDLNAPEDHLRYYADFAKTYDDGFADALGYHTPTALAAFFHQRANRTDMPVADIGCGTGLGASALDLDPKDIDGFDLSADMLQVAKSKDLYRDLHAVDLTKPVPAFVERYGALFSVGTFTLGHLGPVDLGNCMTMLRSGGLVCITISTSHFEAAGFSEWIAEQELAGAISQTQKERVSIYTKTDHDHASDQAYLVGFRKN